MRLARYKGKNYVVETDNEEYWSLPLFGWQYLLDEKYEFRLKFDRWELKCYCHPFDEGMEFVGITHYFMITADNGNGNQVLFYESAWISQKDVPPAWERLENKLANFLSNMLSFCQRIIPDGGDIDFDVWEQENADGEEETGWSDV